MRPEISKMLKIIYPNLVDAPNVSTYPNVKGMDKNLFFIDHRHLEENILESLSKRNPFEAEYIAKLA